MIEARRIDDVTVIIATGRLAAADLVARLRPYAGDEVILDLRGVEPLAPDVTAALGRTDSWCVVAKANVGSVLARFTSIGDALQARALALAGYGPGWASNAA